LTRISAKQVDATALLELTSTSVVGATVAAWLQSDNRESEPLLDPGDRLDRAATLTPGRCFRETAMLKRTDGREGRLAIMPTAAASVDSAG
jgi:hypothetical protein